MRDAECWKILNELVLTPTPKAQQQVVDFELFNL